MSLQDLCKAVETGDQDKGKDLAQKLVDGGTNPLEIIDALTNVMNEIGEKFARLEIFLPEMMMSGEAMRKLKVNGRTIYYIDTGAPERPLVAVDVNTGGDTSPAAGLKANLAAVKDLPRQLRLRGLGGQIVIDPAPTAKKDRRQIESALRSALKRDSVETVFVGWTPLGHIELQRKRDRLSLSEVLT